MVPMSKLYRGWWVLAGLFLVYAASNGLLVHTLPLTYPALIDEFGWDQVQVTLPATVFLVIAAISSPPIGALLDRFSARLVISVGSIGMVLGLLAFSFVTELWHLVAVYVVFAFSLSACGIVANMLVLSRWFDRLRGRATGILLMASSLGASVFPLILGATMDSYGWRGALVIFAIIAAAITIVPLIFLVRDWPEDVGLTIDGNNATSNSKGLAAEGVQTPVASGPTLLEAARQPRFYLIAVITGGVWFTVISLLQHQPIYLAKDLGLSSDLLPRVFSTFFAFSVGGKLCFGWLSDRLDKGLTLVLSTGVLTASLVLLRSLDGDARVALFAYAALGGIGFSGAFTTIQLWIASFYAGHAYGKILAVLTLFDTLSGALGTRVVANMRTSFDSYTPAIDLMIAICVFAMLCVTLIKRSASTAVYEKRLQRAER